MIDRWLIHISGMFTDIYFKLANLQKFTFDIKWVFQCIYLMQFVVYAINITVKAGRPYVNCGFKLLT